MRRASHRIVDLQKVDDCDIVRAVVTASPGDLAAQAVSGSGLSVPG
jgi:hypothetical protein